MGGGKKKGRSPSTPNPGPRLLDVSLLPPRSHLLVAVSGGADSLALLHLLHEQAARHSWKLTVAHLNHGIRGKASDADSAFVADVARRLHLPCVIGKACVPALARRKGISLEMAAREARYTFLFRTARAVKADRIVTAHHADDQVETILLKLVRGAGRGGLSGMAASSGAGTVPIVRPLLRVSRGAMESLLKRRKIAWREDESNRDTDFLRNRVRHDLLPFLERKFNPRIRDAILRMGTVLSAEDEWMDELARGIVKTCAVPGTGGTVLRMDDLCAYPLAARRRVIRLWLAGQGVPVSCLDFDGIARVESLMGRRRGSQTITLAEGWQVQRQYDLMNVCRPGAAAVRPPAPVKPVLVTVPGETRVEALGVRITVTVEPGLVKDRGRGPGVLPARASLNGQVWANRPLRVRACREGDRLAPFGMRGTRKIQDILVDAKIPRRDRARVPVLECGGELVWLPGYRINREWAVGDGRAPNIQVLVEPLGPRHRGRFPGAESLSGAPWRTIKVCEEEVA